ADELVGEREPDGAKAGIEDQPDHQHEQRRQEEERGPRVAAERGPAAGGARARDRDAEAAVAVHVTPRGGCRRSLWCSFPPCPSPGPPTTCPRSPWPARR